MCSTEPRTRPSSWTASASELLRDARWQKLKGELDGAPCVDGQRKVRVEDFLARRPSDGFSFGGSSIRREVPGDPALPTLALWFDLENVPSARASAVEALFEELVEEAMLRHSGVQALVGKTTAMYATSLETVEYERACGIHGQCTLQRSWLTRFLRAVPVGTLWLGESLARSIPDLRALEGAVRVQAFGRALRLTIENERAAEEAERALAPLLPSAEDWRAATRRL